MKLTDEKGIKTALWKAHELLEADDINSLGELTYKTVTDLLISIVSKDDATSSTSDVVLFGMNVEVDSAMTVKVKSGAAVSYQGYYMTESGAWGFVSQPGSAFSALIGSDQSITLDNGGASDRIDLIQIRPIQVNYDSKNRAFIDPITKDVTTGSTETKREYSVEVSVVKGTEGAAAAPSKTAGWIKVAEITVPASASSLTQSNIKDAREVDSWTTESSATKYRGVAWDEDRNYSINDITSYQGILIRSKQNKNKGNVPTFDPSDAWWAVVETGGGSSSVQKILNAVNSTGILIPFYNYPADVYNNTTWNGLIDFARRNRTIPVVVVINPSNGPGTVADGNYTAGIKRLQGANITVVGYISTDYTNRSLDLAKQDAVTWQTLYPEIDGVFFDEMTYDSDSAHIAYYKELRDYCKNLGFNYVVANPGSPFTEEYYEVADIIIGWENSSYPTLSQAKEDYAGGAADHNYNKRAVLVHSQSTFDSAQFSILKKYYGWVYVTEDVLANPWDTLSGYMQNMADEIVVSTGSEIEVISGSALSDRAVVYIDTDGKVYNADKRYLSKCYAAGITKSSVSDADTSLKIAQAGKVDGFTGLVAGTQYFLGNDGALCVAGDIDYFDNKVYIGTAIDSETLDIQIGPPQYRENKDDGLPIGSIIFSANSTTIAGYLPFAYNNKVSTANYPVLYSVIGDKFEKMHTDAGDPSSGSGYFYPTPIPGYFPRPATPDTEEIDSTSDIDTSNDTITLSTDDYNTLRRSRDATATNPHGVPVLLKLESGALPAGLAEDTVYYIRFTNDTNHYIKLYTTEENAINDTSAVDITGTDTGKFKLTQAGIYQRDAFQGHKHEGPNSYGSDVGYGSANIANANTVSSGSLVGNPIVDGTNGTPRTSNETRPNEVFLYGYIKAEYITPAGEPVSALRYQWERGSSTSWQSQDITINHNLNAELKDLIVVVEIKRDGVFGWQVVREASYDKASGADQSYGVALEAVDQNNFKIKTGANGLHGIHSTSFSLAALYNGVTGNMRVTIYKPALLATYTDAPIRTKYNITDSTDHTVNLPDANGQTAERTYWRTGSGSGKVLFSTYGSQTINGLSASSWELENEEKIVLFPYGGNWYVKEYGGYDESGNYVLKANNGYGHLYYPKKPVASSSDLFNVNITSGGSHTFDFSSQVPSNATSVYTFLYFKADSTQGYITLDFYDDDSGEYMGRWLNDYMTDNQGRSGMIFIPLANGKVKLQVNSSTSCTVNIRIGYPWGYMI